MSVAEERIAQHIFRFVEKELYDYPINKKLIETWEEDSQEIAGELRSALANSGKEFSGRFAKNKVSSPASAKAMRLLSIAAKVDRAKWYVRAINDVLGTLNEEGRHLVELKYMQALLTNTGVARELHISVREFYDRRQVIIEKFALRMGLI